MSECVGVILAAGRGRRMGELGDRYPKTLLPVGGDPLIGHHLRLLVDAGIPEILVVVGHQRERIAAALGDGAAYGARLQFVQQGQALGSAHALVGVRPLVKGHFVVLLGDYFFRASDPSAVIRHLQDGACAIATKREADPRLVAEACAIEVDGTGRVVDVVEKPAVPGDRLKGCGMYACTPEFFDALARTPRTALRDEYEITVALELYVRSGRPLFAEEVILWDANLTRPVDLLECNLRWLSETGQVSFAAPGARIEPDVVLDESIAGRGARIGRGARLRHVIVFPGATVAPGAFVERALVTPSSVVPC